MNARLQKNVVGFLAAALAFLVGTCAFGAPAKVAKLKVYTKGADAVKAAEAADKPILIYFHGKGFKADSYEAVQKNKTFMNDLVAKNFVFFKCVPKINLKGNAQTIVGLSTNDQAMVDAGFQGADGMWGYGYAILDKDGGKALVKGGYGGLSQPKADLPFNVWLQTFVASCEEKKVELDVSPAVKKAMEDEPLDDKTGKKKRK